MDKENELDKGLLENEESSMRRTNVTGQEEEMYEDQPIQEKEYDWIPNLPAGDELPHIKETRDQRKSSLDLNVTDLIPKDRLDFGKNLVRGQRGEYAKQVMCYTMNKADQDKYKLTIEEEGLTEDEAIAKHYNMTNLLCNKDMDDWLKLSTAEQKFTVNLSGFEYFFYYLFVILTTQLTGPLTAIFFFCIPGLYRQENVHVSIGGTDKKLPMGWQVPAYYFFQFCALWAAGEGPSFTRSEIYPNIKYLIKGDTPLPGFSRSCLMLVYFAMYPKVMRLHVFSQENEVKQEGWKFDQWKHELQIDEETFEFDMINRTGKAEQYQIPGCKMLPHLKSNKTVDMWLKVLCVVIPLIYLVMYAIDLKEDKCDAQLDPIGYGMCFNPKEYKNNATFSAWCDKPVNRKAVGASKYIKLKAFGNGKRDAVAMFIGYLVEMWLLRYIYCLCWNTLRLHSTFIGYLQGLLDLQNYHCNPQSLDNFYYYTQQESCYDKQTWEATRNAEQIKYNIQCGEDVCAKILAYDYDVANPELQQNKIIAPIDMCNVKNIQNLMILRQMSFRIYQPLAMEAQTIIIFCSFVFGLAFYVLFASVFTPGTSLAYFYMKYTPKELWWYLILFAITYFIPCIVTLFLVFWYEMQINSWMTAMGNQWFGQAAQFSRISNFSSHYFTTIPVEGNENNFVDTKSTVLVLKEWEDEIDNAKTRANYTIQEVFYYRFPGYKTYTGKEIDTYSGNLKESLPKPTNLVAEWTTQLDTYRKDQSGPPFDERKPKLLSTTDTSYNKIPNTQGRQRHGILTNSDNSYVSYIVQRIAQDHGDSKESVSQVIDLMLAPAYSAAIADMNGDMLACQFYFFNLFPINQQFMTTLSLMAFWTLYGKVMALLTSMLSQVKKVKKTT